MNRTPIKLGAGYDCVRLANSTVNPVHYIMMLIKDGCKLKMRVWELAKEAGVNGKEALKILKSLGIDARNHMSTIRGENIQQFLSRFESTPKTSSKFHLALEFVDGKFRFIWVSESGVFLRNSSIPSDSTSVFSCCFFSRLSTQQRSICEFEDLLSTPATTEHDIRRFLYTHQELFALLGYEDARTEICLPATEDYEERRIDFLLKPIGEEFYDLLELKRHDCNAYTKMKGIVGFSANVYRALEQARRYRTIIDHSSNIKNHFEQRLGVKCHLPKCIIFIGKSGDDIPSEQKRDLKRTIDPDWISSYDELVEQLKKNLEARMR